MDRHLSKLTKVFPVIAFFGGLLLASMGRDSLEKLLFEIAGAIVAYVGIALALRKN